MLLSKLRLCPLFQDFLHNCQLKYQHTNTTGTVERCNYLPDLQKTNEQLVEHIKINHLDCEQQHGFTTGNSINTNLLEALNVGTEALMHNIPVDVIYLNYASHTSGAERVPASS